MKARNFILFVNLVFCVTFKEDKILAYPFPCCCNVCRIPCGTLMTPFTKWSPTILSASAAIPSTAFPKPTKCRLCLSENFRPLIMTESSLRSMLCRTTVSGCTASTAAANTSRARESIDILHSVGFLLPTRASKGWGRNNERTRAMDSSLSLCRERLWNEKRNQKVELALKQVIPISQSVWQGKDSCSNLQLITKDFYWLKITLFIYASEELITCKELLQHGLKLKYVMVLV